MLPVPPIRNEYEAKRYPHYLARAIEARDELEERIQRFGLKGTQNPHEHTITGYMQALSDWHAKHPPSPPP